MNCLHHSSQPVAAVIGALPFARVMLTVCSEGEGAV